MLAGVAAALLVSAWVPQQAPLDRRAVLSGAAAAAALMPASAMARSKEKAAEKAAQKATAAEARQAMKEYKYAPRPVLEGNAETGYSYKAGTVQAGSTGELSSYFKDKGAMIQAEYAEDRAKASGLSSAEAKKVAAKKLEAFEAEKKAKAAEKSVLSEDAKKIKEFCAKNPDVLDNLGNKMCK